MNWVKLIFVLWGIQSLSAQSILVEPQEFNKYAGDTSIQKLDVRTGLEFELVGHIPGFFQISIVDQQFEEKVKSHFQTNQPILVTCFSGHRSIDAVKKLEQMGFTKIIELKGGLINWMGKGYALE